MKQREAFLRAIVENPADDTPRLVYADWLDEHDELDRAGFIRVQTDAGVLALAASPHLDNMRRIALDGNPITPASRARLGLDVVSDE